MKQNKGRQQFLKKNVFILFSGLSCLLLKRITCEIQGMTYLGYAKNDPHSTGMSQRLKTRRFCHKSLVFVYPRTRISVSVFSQLCMCACMSVHADICVSVHVCICECACLYVEYLLAFLSAEIKYAACRTHPSCKSRGYFSRFCPVPITLFGLG